MRFRVLGPLEGESAEGPMRIGSGLQRTLLAALLLNAGRTVGVDRLAAYLWDGEPGPADVRGALQLHVFRLRKSLPEPERVETLPGGYRIRVSAAELDLLRFGELAAAGSAAFTDGRLDDADRATGEALDLWRGPVLRDVESVALFGDHAPALTERRLATVELWSRVRIARGAPESAIGRLRQTVGEHPLREPSWTLLVSALDAAGRRAEALDAFHAARLALRDELGAEPGEALMNAYRSALGPSTAGSSPVPRQLPTPPRLLVGRDSESRALDGLRADGSARLAVVTGTAGVGKTSLVRKWAHANADEFPDGQFYVYLRGHAGGDPVDPARALAGLLTAIGVPGQAVPATVDERASLWRSAVSGQRILLVVDDARTAGDVRPLLPGPGSAVVVTSRDSLEELIVSEGAVRVALNRFGDVDAHDLLTAVAGAPRFAAEPEATRRLIAYCAGLPLALRLLGERLARFPEAPLADFAAELNAEHDRLAVLGSSDGSGTDLRAVFSWSFRCLEKEPARLLKLLSRWPGPDLNAHAAAVWTGSSIEDAGAILRRMVAANLVEEPRPGRYSLHDLLREYLAARAEHEDGPLPTASLRRAVDWYVHTGHRVISAMPPGWRVGPLPSTPSSVAPTTFGDSGQGERWFDGEAANMLAVARLAREHGRPEDVCHLGPLLIRFLFYVKRIDEWEASARLTFDTATEVGRDDVRAAAAANLGLVAVQRQELTKAASYTELAVRIRSTGTDRYALGREHRNLGIVYRKSGRLAEARAQHHEAARIFAELGLTDAEHGVDLNNLAHVDIEEGAWDDAVRRLTEAVDWARAVGRGLTEANALDGLGQALTGRGDLTEAIARFREAHRIYREIRNDYQAATTESALADVLDRVGAHEDAARHRASAERVLGRR